MTDNGSELRAVAWSQAFPFVRLFRTLRLALDAKRLTLALAGVMIIYLGGRVLDAVRPRSSGVAAVVREGRVHGEIEAYAGLKYTEFEAWRREAVAARERLELETLKEAGKAVDPADASTKLASASLRKLVMDKAHQDELAALRKLVDDRLSKGLKVIDGDQVLSAADKRTRRDRLSGHADTLRRMLAGMAERRPDASTERSVAIAKLVEADPQVSVKERADDQARLTTAAASQARLQQYDQLKPRGPFISLLDYEMHCFAAAIQGVCAGRWGFVGGAFDPAPTLAGSLYSAVRGFCWFVHEHFWYALIYGLFELLVCAYFGGALCRSAAVQSARDESIPWGEALKFAREKFGGFLLAPLLPVGVCLGIGLLMFLGGLVGAIGYVGELFTGVFYVLALLGGFALAIIVLATLFGFHLMWPTIAVEGSDGFDALSRACSYVGSRIWHVGFYTFVLLAYGGVSFVIVRGVTMLTLKLAHTFTGFGMNRIASAELAGGGKLNALWQMPAWSDLALLPSTGDTPFWGTFHNAPLDATESIALFLLRCWIYLVVGLVGAFIVSFFFCGSTQMYFLLRRDMDANDFEEVYYEEPEEEPPTAPAPSAATEPANAAETGFTETPPDQKDEP